MEVAKACKAFLARPADLGNDIVAVRALPGRNLLPLGRGQAHLTPGTRGIRAAFGLVGHGLRLGPGLDHLPTTEMGALDQRRFTAGAALQFPGVDGGRCLVPCLGGSHGMIPVFENSFGVLKGIVCHKTPVYQGQSEFCGTAKYDKTNFGS
jgi:hypothetical protein